MEQLERDDAPAPSLGIAGEILRMLDATLAAAMQPAGRAAAEARRLADHATATALSFPSALQGDKAPPNPAS